MWTLGQKASGFERFLTPSVSKIEEEVSSLHEMVKSINEKMTEAENRLTSLEESQKVLSARMDKNGDVLTAESKVLIDSITEMEKQDRDEIASLKRLIDVAQRRVAVLEAKMKELGQ